MIENRSVLPVGGLEDTVSVVGYLLLTVAIFALLDGALRLVERR